ncbi:LuxR C-terminal-related transcriptional regulator [Conexibacter arvalis]|uniref:LuxR family maltose regulon positive regulatory protein n=1 Tax=Conexibacter arvalis TaxID=912552 RepID=A0A840II80_9ACTN|nr:LuxR C-terminal-related transcriptional regulator [Conexibacter arvalis]MBB4664777.1 LuxR family maltose regulon positive regulatory protein [Conexibacter arvalis]
MSSVLAHDVGDPAREEVLDTVPRRDLAQRLAETSRTVIGLVVAPSGYGKTAFLRQWARSDPRPVAWVTVRPGQDAPDAIAGRLADLDQAAGTGPLALVLDDAQLIPAQAAETVLLAADRLPTGSLVVLASTCEPPLPVGRLRLEGRLREVRARDLAMTPVEGRQLLQRAGVLLDSDQLATVMRITEGWPAGLSLAALALGGDGGIDALDRFGGDDRVVADYLRDAFLDGLPAHQLDLLVRTSVLDELSGPLCDAVAGQRGSGCTLRELSRSNILLEPLDRSEQRFRLHPLLRGLLRSELRRSGSDLERAALRRAAAWFDADGDRDRAVRHAAAAGDAGLAGRLLWGAAASCFLQGDAAGLERELQRFTSAQAAAVPGLAACKAVAGLGRNERQYVEYWTEAAELALRRSGDERSPDVAACIALLRAAIARDGVAQMGADARRAYELDGAGQRTWRPLACFLDGAARHLTADPGGAREQLAEGVQSGAVGAPIAVMLCRAQLALIELASDGRDEGARHAELAHACAEDHDLDDEPLAALAYAASAFALALQGRVDASRRDADRAGRLLRGLSGALPWLEAEIHVALARTELRLSDSEAARQLLTNAGRLVRYCSDATVVRTAIDDGWERADAFAAAAVAGVSPLTAAELRVLRMLPSHMSLREIAERLHVSQNTVKTQAHAAYRKLDVSSRSDAVRRARSVGLVDP